MRQLIFVFFALAFLLPSCHSETITLKSGKTIDAEIIERTDEYIKIEIGGTPVAYYLDEIESIEGADTSSGEIDTEHIRRLLEEMQYPEHTWPDIERELTAFLVKIDFSQLKKEAAQVKSNPTQLIYFVSKIGDLFEREGFLNYQFPHPLSKLLATSFHDEDIFQVIDATPISSEQREKLKTDLLACPTISQLGSIILDLLDCNVKIAVTPQHVFNYIPLDEKQILFVDFTKQACVSLDLKGYYKLEGKYWVLKDEYRIPDEKVHEILEQLHKGNKLKSPMSPIETLNVAYANIHITDDCACTFIMHSDCSRIYLYKGDYDQAILDCNKALEANVNFAEAYHNRGLAYGYKNNYNQAISDFTKAIEINPHFASTYNNRATAYFFQGDYSRAWDDVHKAESLGVQLNAKFLQDLRRASGRDQ